MSDAGDAGLVVAIIGSDGAGKSTLCRDLAEEWRARGPVDQVYFGSGDGPSSWLRWPLVQLRRVLSGAATVRQATGRPPKGPAFAAEPRRGSVIAVARALWALTLASEKQAKLRSVRRARDRGHVIVCDRFPQAQVGGLMDGPLLHAWLGRPRGARRRLARWEARPYLRAQREPPDLVLRLIVDQERAQQRRPDHDPVDLVRRRAIISALRFDGSRFGVVDVDATRSADEVRSAALAAIEACRHAMIAGDHHAGTGYGTVSST